MTLLPSVNAANEIVTITVGQSKTLCLPSYITSKPLKGTTWTTTHPYDVVITSQGPYSAVIKANNTITTTCLIHCQYYYFQAIGTFTYMRTDIYDFEIRVEGVKPTSISLPSNATLDVGESMVLTPTVYPANAENTFTWFSQNNFAIDVSQNGKVLAKREGTSLITVVTANGLSASCLVTCKATIPKLVITDRKDLLSIPEKADVYYERKLYKGWNSICVPFALNLTMFGSEGVKMAVFKDVETIGDKKYLSFDLVDKVEAGMPCMVYVLSDMTCKFSLEAVKLVKVPNTSTPLKGTFVNTIIGKGVYKLTTDGSALAQTKTDAANLSSFRGYIKLNDADRYSTKNISIQVIEEEK